MKTERQITKTNSLAVWNGKGCFPPRGSASSLRGDRSSTDAAAEGNLNVVSCVEEEEVEHCWRRRIVAFNLLTRSFSPASSFISNLFFSSEASVFLASSTRRQEFSQNSFGLLEESIQHLDRASLAVRENGRVDAPDDLRDGISADSLEDKLIRTVLGNNGVECPRLLLVD